MDDPKNSRRTGPVARQRANGRLLPGSRLNPTGRPKRPVEIEADAVALWGPRVSEVLGRLHQAAMRGSVPAAVAFLDRVLGRPRQRAEITGADGSPFPPPSYAEVRAKLERLAASAGLPDESEGNRDDVVT